MSYLSEALDLVYATQANGNPHHPLLAGLHASVALCLIKSHQEDLAKSHIHKAQELASTSSDKQTQSICYHMLALTHLDQGEFQLSLDFIKEEYALLEQIDDPYSVVNTQLVEVQLLNAQKNFPQAIALAQSAVVDAQVRGYGALVFHFYKALAEAYWETQDFESAATHFKNYSEAFERTMTLEVENRISMMSTEIRIKEQAQSMQDKMRQSHMAALTELVNGVAHEINTPLGNAIGLASFLTAEVQHLSQSFQAKAASEDDPLTAFLDQAQSGLDLLQGSLAKTSAIVERFKKISMDAHMLDLSTIHVATLFKEMHPFTTATFNDQNITIEFDCLQDLVVESYERLIQYVLLQLIENAQIHGFSGAIHAPTINVAAFVDAYNTKVTFSVADNGIGISEAHLDRIFNPFFTTKKAKGGIGLGLNIVYNVVTQVLKGTIDVTSTVNAGTKFTITLPKRMPTVAR